MKYILMNQNTEVLSLEYDEEYEDKIIKIIDIINIEYAPLSVYNAYNNTSKSLLKETVSWFLERSIPSWRKNLSNLLENLSISSRRDLLNKYYALSLSDQYWLKPVDSKVKWEDINFFDNSFDGNTFLDSSILSRIDVDIDEDVFKTPNNTTDGMLPKGWIIDGTKRVLVKSTYEAYNQEPLNEWLASQICKRLGFNFCNYSLDTYKGMIVSKCDNFINKDEEIITAYDIYFSKKKQNNINDATHYINMLESHGIKNAREEFENMLIVDYLVMNKDRHMKNFGVIRNVKTLKWVRLTPIFDTGQAMNCELPAREMTFIDGSGKLFYNTNKSFNTYLSLIKDITRIDITKLDGLVSEYENKLMEYSKVTNISDERIHRLVDGLKLRIYKLSLEIKKEAKR